MVKSILSPLSGYADLALAHPIHEFFSSFFGYLLSFKDHYFLRYIYSLKTKHRSTNNNSTKFSSLSSKTNLKIDTYIFTEKLGPFDKFLDIHLSNGYPCSMTNSKNSGFLWKIRIANKKSRNHEQYPQNCNKALYHMFSKWALKQHKSNKKIIF